ncbi:MAG TPA: hypothetical protein PK453_24850 [Leptospiraceae bacterium]|nr:hypothetical protein [Leptospiraceae bacterium]HMY65818.1 hypothetical protein [Leptospiraceae bacterium]HNF16907.1 hypothetical protein [Leptospiraceae bacterium]HNF24891.1 hypothetical protein [Leptospiraceae bacterium]HNH06915.1 hypothetical protein [Leptospiraceae bacterium]
MKKKKTAVKKKTASKKKKNNKAAEERKMIAEAEAKALKEQQEWENARKEEQAVLRKVLSKAVTRKSEFNLDVLDDSELKILLSALIRFIYDTHTFFSFEYDGKEYHNQPNQWYFGEFDGFPHDPVTPCKGYDECEFEEGQKLVRVQPKPGKKIKYNIDWEGREFDEESKPLVYEIGQVFSQNPILHSRPLILINENFNDDHRGSDHTRIILDFPGKVALKGKKTKMTDFVDALFRLRSHKFENWYEMYYGAEVSSDKKAITVDVMFDHGS